MSVGGVIGAAAGFVISGGTPQGAMLGYSLGSGVEALVNPEQIEGPRLEELRIQMSSYGSAIPFEYGTNRHAGTIIWPKIIELKESEQTESAKGGPETTTYSYSVSMAVLICEGPIAGVRRIWANKKLIYDVSSGVGSSYTAPPPGDEPPPELEPSPGGEGFNAPASGATQDPAIGSIRFYLGTESQQPDPLIEATDGPSPAYLGYAYAVFEDLDLTDFASRPPMLEFEVLTIGDADLPDATSMGPAGRDLAIDPNTGYGWSAAGFYGGGTEPRVEIYITDNATQSLVHTIVQTEDSSVGGLGSPSFGMGYSLCYVDSTNTFWVANENSVDVMIFDAASYALVGMADVFENPHVCIVPPPAPGLNWSGWIRYDKTRDLVLIGRTNLSTKIGAYQARDFFASAVDPCDSSKLYFPNQYPKYVLDPQPSISQLQSLYVTSTGITLAITGSRAVAYNREVVLIDYASPVSLEAARASYDIERNRLLLVRGTFAELVVIDAATGEATTYPYDLPADAPLTASMNFRDVLYHEQNDRYYLTAHLTGLEWTLITINPDTLGIEDVRLPNGPTNLGTMVEVPGVTEYLAYTDSGTGLAWRIPLTATLEPQPVSLGYIVADICERAGLSASDIDVSQLTDDVDGYIVPRQMSARSAIEPLQQAFFFDAVESDDKLKFVKRAASAPILIPMEDRAARDFGADLPDSLAIVRAQDMELPVQVDVEYADIAADHLVGDQYARRLTKDTKSRINIQSPVVMNATKAKQVADVTLYRAWLNQSYKFTTTRKWAHVEPTDLVILPTLEASYTARIMSKREQPSGIIEWEAAMEGVEVYTQSGAGAAPTNYIKQSIYAPGSTMLNLLDIPILRDEDNNAGFYDAMAGTTSAWTGAQLFKSTDGGSTYEPVHIASDPATIGVTQSALPDFTAGNIVDEGSSVTVVLKSGRALASVTDAQLFNGANLAIIGKPGRWEVIQFRTAALIAANTYQLSGLLRGRRGTEWATSTHEAGDTFIIASPTGWSRLVANADVGLERKYKAPAFRMPLSSAPAMTFTNGAIGLKPFSPVDLAGERDGSNNLTIKWNRRTRLATGTLHMPAPLGEASESYSVDIMSGETVLRTLTSSTPTVTYSAADQTADGITPGEAVTVNVYQLSQAVGRGYPLQGTV